MKGLLKDWRAFIDDERRVFRLFIVGTVLCFLGMAMLVFIDRSVEPSLEQELSFAVALILTGLGFATAILTHIILLLRRLRKP